MEDKQSLRSDDLNFLKVAKEAALEAGEIISKYFGKKHKYKFKNEDKSDFATQADLESEKKIVEILTKNFPTHNIIAEEGGKTDKNSQYTWVIDPLDGTIAFSYGMPYFAVCIGLMKNNKPMIGVIYHILENNLYTAIEGKGAYVNGKPIHVTGEKDLFRASMMIDFGSKPRRAPKIDLYILPLLKEVGHANSIGSSSMDMALTAKGIQDGMIAQAWIWDFAAGTVIVREAGGMVTDFEGRELDWSKDRLNMVASNGLIHDQILGALRK